MRLIALLLLILSLPSFAVVNAVADKVALDTQCANGRMGKGKCPAGHALQPAYLAFSDLITGPDTGLGDSLGSGAIVTVWGQNLGASQSNSTIEFCDSAATCRSGHVYYWKNADGALPGGPANLFESHKMQEIAFSIPDSATGAGTIRVTVNGNQSSLPFTVRAGNIYHVKATGNDTTGNGSFSNPWLTSDKVTANGSSVPSGSIIYFHTMQLGTTTTPRPIYWNNASASSGASNQFVISSYPNQRTTVEGIIGVSTYNTSGMVVSKLFIKASNCDEGANGQPINCNTPNAKTAGIEADAFGRAVANKITDRTDGCASNAQAAIVGNSAYEDNVSDYKIIGNEVYDYGCAGSNKLHHTTYMSIRSAPADEQIPPFSFAYNYLHGNQTKNGIHVFDQDANCGDLTGDLLIHDNVVIDQSGASIYVGSSGCDWSHNTTIANNLIINSGKASSWDGLSASTSTDGDANAITIWDTGYSGIVTIKNNTIWGWDVDLASNSSSVPLGGCFGFFGSLDLVTVLFNDNVCLTSQDSRFISWGYQADNKLDNISGSNNVFYYTGTSPTNATQPTQFTSTINANPLLNRSVSSVSVGAGSPVINASSTNLTLDLYGVPRAAASNLGAIQ